MVGCCEKLAILGLDDLLFHLYIASHSALLFPIQFDCQPVRCLEFLCPNFSADLCKDHSDRGHTDSQGKIDPGDSGVQGYGLVGSIDRIQHLPERDAGGVLIRPQVEHERDGRAGRQVGEVDDGLVRARVRTQLRHLRLIDRNSLPDLGLEVLEAVDDVRPLLEGSFVAGLYQPRFQHDLDQLTLDLQPQATSFVRVDLTKVV